MSILECTEVSRSFAGPDGAVHALSDLSLTVESSELVVVRGPSGCGKTTLLLVAGALLRPSAGEVRVDGQDPYALDPNRRSALRAEAIGFVFQQFYLVPYLDVLDNVLAPSVAKPQPKAADRARELIQRFGLEHRLHHVPSQLSTGERQRTALARALMNQPKLILADEPTGNLDQANGDVVLHHLSEFTKDGGAALVVTHDARVAELADRTITMQNGKAVEEETKQ